MGAGISYCAMLVPHMLGNRYMYPLMLRKAEILQVWWKLCSAHAHPWLNAWDMHLLMYLLLHALTCMVNISSQRAIQGSRLQAAASQQFQGSSARKEGYSKQIQGLKQFQDSADRTRKKTQGGIQGSQRPSPRGVNTSGSQRPGIKAEYKLTHFIYFIVLLFEFYI